jgi:hypothetical protein
MKSIRVPLACANDADHAEGLQWAHHHHHRHRHHHHHHHHHNLCWLDPHTLLQPISILHRMHTSSTFHHQPHLSDSAHSPQAPIGSTYLASIYLACTLPVPPTNPAPTLHPNHRMMIPGVHPTGPYHLPSTHTMNLTAKVDWAFQEYHATLGPAPPDLVVLTAALWDLARMRGCEPWLMGCSNGDYRSGQQCQLAEHLHHATVHGYMRNLTMLVQHVKTWVPQVRMELRQNQAWRSMARRAVLCCAVLCCAVLALQQQLLKGRCSRSRSCPSSAARSMRKPLRGGSEPGRQALDAALLDAASTRQRCRAQQPTIHTCTCRPR